MSIYGKVDPAFIQEMKAIVGEKKEPHQIIQEKCIKCGACMEKCKFSAIYIN